MRMSKWLLPLVLWAAAGAAQTQNYKGPRPPKPDIPYLVHADNLIATEVSEAREQQPRKNEILYTVSGPNSPVKTPLASPVFLLQTAKLEPGRLQLFRLQSKDGQRQVLFRKNKDTNRPIRLSVTRLTRDNLFRIEVDESLENGEYSLTPEGTNQVFCFQVY